mgnify:CR=1 FL=1
MNDILNVDISDGIKNIDVNGAAGIGKVDFISDNGSDNNSDNNYIHNLRSNAIYTYQTANRTTINDNTFNNICKLII